MLDQFSLPLIIAAASALISLISIIIALTAIGKYRSIYRQYDAFMRGRDAESLEDLIIEEKQRIEVLEKSDLTNKEVMRAMNRNIRASFQKAGVVRYDAFDGMGGKMSFAAALLDYTNTGIILNCMHGTSGCFLYIKEVEAGATDVQLGAEENGALERALGYVED